MIVSNLGATPAVLQVCTTRLLLDVAELHILGVMWYLELTS